MPVSDAAARLAAAWLAAWHEAGLLGTDPEVRGFVEDLLNFVGERAMSEDGNRLVNEYARQCREALAAANDARRERDEWFGAKVNAEAERDAALARVQNLEADVARLREGLRPFAEWYAKFGEDNIDRTCVGDYRRAAQLLGGAE